MAGKREHVRDEETERGQVPNLILGICVYGIGMRMEGGHTEQINKPA